jgi:gas vesicle protein
MSVNAKHIATFILGAAAGVAMAKYFGMTEEEREKLFANLKEKASGLKGEAEDAFDKAKDYFEELKTKGADALKDHLAEAEKMMQDLFNKNKEAGTPPPGQ